MRASDRSRGGVVLIFADSRDPGAEHLWVLWMALLWLQEFHGAVLEVCNMKILAKVL